MITLKQAIDLFRENTKNKRILNISIWDNKYVFESRSKLLKKDDLDWDSTCEVIDIYTGEFSTMDGFNIDYIKNAKNIKNF